MSKALVVDDSKTIRMILKRTLAEVGFDVCEAGNGQEALNALQAEGGTVTLALVDWNMPEMNGLEFLIELRRRPEFSAIKVIMVTTEAESGHMVSALEAGANEYVMKPFTKEILKEKLQLAGALAYASC
ncbi:MAG: response regulator [Terracidiphilus sp.]|jgi:two-component system chemotaxis response regulator CheY